MAKKREHDLDVYNEESLEELEEADEIDEVEQGFMEGYDKAGKNKKKPKRKKD